MADNYYLLSEADRDLLKKVANLVNQRPVNNFRRPDVPETTDYAPEVYVAFTPPGGIPAMQTIGTGSAEGVGDVPGSATCGIYAIEYDIPSTKYMIQATAAQSKLVFNISELPVSGNTFVPVIRDKFGSWLVNFSRGGGTASPVYFKRSRIVEEIVQPIYVRRTTLINKLPTPILSKRVYQREEIVQPITVRRAIVVNKLPTPILTRRNYTREEIVQPIHVKRTTIVNKLPTPPTPILSRRLCRQEETVQPIHVKRTTIVNKLPTPPTPILNRRLCRQEEIVQPITVRRATVVNKLPTPILARRVRIEEKLEERIVPKRGSVFVTGAAPVFVNGAVSASANQTVAAFATAQINYDTVISDTGSEFNTTTHKYVANATRNLIFWVRVAASLVTGTVAGCEWFIRKNGVNQTTAGGNIDAGTGVGLAAYNAVRLSVSPGDTVDVSFENLDFNGNSMLVQNGTTLSLQWQQYG